MPISSTRRPLPAILSLTLAIATLLGTTSCTAESEPPQVAAAVEAPVFALESQALHAAEISLSNYLTAEQAVAALGGTDPSVLQPTSTPEQFEQDLAGFASFRDAKLRRLGNIVVLGLQLQQWYEDEGRAFVLIYACLDYSNVTVWSADGHEITPVGFQQPLRFEVGFQSSDEEPSRLLLANNHQVDEAGRCASS